MNIDPYLVGVLYGDGSISKRKDGAYAVWIDQVKRNRDIIERVKSQFKQLGLKVFAYRYYAKADHTFKYRALVYSKKLFLELRKIFKDISNYTKKLAAGAVKSFIAGFLDAEGTVTDRVVIYNKNLELLQTIQDRLTRMDIPNVYIYKFGVVEGLQIYRMNSLRKLVKEIPSVKLNRPSSLTNRIFRPQSG